MLSLFPSLLDFQLLSPTIIRVTLAVVLLYRSYESLKHTTNSNQKILSVIEGLLGILLFLGLYVQGAALILAIDFLVRLVIKVKSKSFMTSGVNYYFLLFILCLSLLLTGAGLFAFDLAI